MARFHNVGGKRVQFTAEEETLRDVEEKAWEDAASTRRMNRLRDQRNLLLAETDWMANTDVTMSEEWKTYRQALRDITKQTLDNDEMDKDGLYTSITYPKKPTE